MEKKLLRLTNYEFHILCHDFESGDFYVGVSENYKENVEFVKEILNIVRIETGFGTHTNNAIYFILNLNLDQVDKLKTWIKWTYTESFDSYLRSEDKKEFLKLKSKILNL